MSWVERYGIVGAYCFLLFSGLLFGGLFIPILEIPEVKITSGMATIIIALFFPIGYLMISIGQLIYYCNCKMHPWPLDLKVLENIRGRINGKDLKQKDISNEIKKINTQLEAEVFIVKNTRLKETGDKFENIHKWLSKRNYVMAINSAIIITTILGVGSSIVIIVCKCMYKSYYCTKINNPLFTVTIITSILLSSILCLQNKKLMNLNTKVLAEYVLNSLKLSKNMGKKEHN